VYKNVQEAADKLRSRDKRLSPELAIELATSGTRALEGGERVFKHDPLHLSLGPIGFSTDVAQTFWRRITCPVLLVDGAESKLNHTQEERERRRSFLPAPKVVVMEDAGHMMQRHQPAELSRILLEFLS
jgi:pimeloyl-ACP methyl ester carboxylesterase